MVLCYGLSVQEALELVGCLSCRVNMASVVHETLGFYSVYDILLSVGYLILWELAL